MTDFKSQQIKTVLKDLLRKKKMTYEDVAETLECSVPTVKRILGPEELTLTRLLEFCDILEVTLSDIEVLTNMTKVAEENFTQEQEEFFAKNGHYLSYFLKLYEMTPDKIAEKYKLNQRSTDKYLMTLENLGAIVVNAKQKVRPAFKEMPSLGHGTLAKAHFEKFVNSGNNFFIKHLSDRLYAAEDLKKANLKVGYSLNAITCTDSTYRNYIDETIKAREAFGKLASYEEKSQPAEKLKTAVIMAGWTFVDSDNKDLEFIGNTLGEIRNL